MSTSDCGKGRQTKSTHKKVEKFFNFLLTNQLVYAIIITPREREEKQKMWKKKKNEIIETTQDLRIKNLRSERYEIRQDLEEAVRLVIIRNGVIEIYPKGADKEKAIKDAESAKKELLYEIGRFDNINKEFKIALNSAEERVTTKDWAKNVITSHEIVEYVYKNFFKEKY